MILGTRPTIGWLGYIIIGKSNVRLICIIAILGAISMMLLKRSKDSLTLQFMSPVLGASSVIILPPPKYTSINSFDACAVEANLAAALSMKSSSKPARPVYLYLWFSNVAPNDVWVQFLSKLKGVTILYLNLVKSLGKTPVDGMLSWGGWGGRPDWAIWLASGGSLLWKSGGILMPTGILVTKPITVEAFGNNSGLLVAKSNKIHPIAFGSPPHHVILDQILDSVQNFDHSLYDSYAYEEEAGTPLENLLTKAVSTACNLSDLEEIGKSKCKNFNVMDRSTLFDIDFEKPSSLNEEKARFLRFTGNPDTLKYDLGQSKRFFRKHGLIRYCPQVYRFLEYEARKQL